MAEMFILFVFCKTAAFFEKIGIKSAKIIAGNHI